MGLGKVRDVISFRNPLVLNSNMLQMRKSPFSRRKRNFRVEGLICDPNQFALEGREDLDNGVFRDGTHTLQLTVNGGYTGSV